MASSPDIATLSIGDFEPHLNATFELSSSGGIVPLKLVQTASPARPDASGCPLTK